jgi:hypothetical protein
MRLAVAAIVVIIVPVVPSAAVAQERGFGVKVGPSFPVITVDPNDGQGYDKRITAAGGGFVVLPVSRPFAVQIEALRSPKGAKVGSNDVGGTTSLLLDYFDVPVLVRVSAPGPRGFHVFGGPYMGTRLSAKSEYKQLVNSMNSGSHQDISDSVKRVDLGVVAGGGMHLGRHGVIDGRYAWGLRNIAADTSDAVKIKNRALTFMAGVRF